MSTDAVALSADQPAPFPMRFDIQRPPSQSRLTNFPLFIGSLIRLILLVPHLIVLYFFQLLANLVYLIATFAILFTGRYPQGLYNLYAGYLRWTANVYGYMLHVYDKYPPFTTDQQADYPLRLEFEYPEKMSRILNFPILGLFIKIVLAIPHLIVLTFLMLAVYVVVFIAQFAILFTGSFPEGMHRFVTGVGRWYLRLSAYLYAMTDKYPPFSTN